MLGNLALAAKEVHTEFEYENLKARDNMEDLVVDGRIILKGLLKKENEKVWAELI
jgi:hypothetical protein